jgi:NitT/TauT family transport system substrate-binding protein
MDVSRLARLLCGVCLLLAACSPAAPAQPTPPAAPTAAAQAGTKPTAAPQVASSPASASPVASPAAAVAPLNPPVKVRAGTLSLAIEAPLYVAFDKGYFRDEGLDVDIIPFATGGDQIAPITTGQLDIASASPDPSQFNAIARGIDIKLVETTSVWVPGSNVSALVVRQDLVDSGRYKTPADLKGMTISMPNLNSSGRLYVDRILAMGGLTGSDANLVPLAFADASTGLANKAVDASWLSEPFITTARQLNIASVAVPAGDAVPTGSAGLMMFLSPAFATQQPEAARRFATAWLRGSRDAWRALETRTQDPDEVIASINAHTALKDPNQVKAIAANKGLVGFPPNGGISADQLSIFQDFFVKVGSETQPADLAKAIDTSYNDYALQRLGRVSP